MNSIEGSAQTVPITPRNVQPLASFVASHEVAKTAY